jgi:prepilin-type N-terminal cleavage/methylation domain-containing protein
MIQDPRFHASESLRGAPYVVQQTTPRGLTLLEVILAIAILGGCMTVIGELVRMGVRHAEEAREQTKAQLLCESKLEEIAAGVTALESASMVPFELDPEWTYTIESASLDEQGLIQVRVTVQPAESDRLHPIAFTLTRWMLDPNLALGEDSTGSITEGQTQPSGGGDATN